jgi:hypothetical protein
VTSEIIKTAEELLEMYAAAKSDQAKSLIAYAVEATRRFEDVCSDLLAAMEYCRRQIERAHLDLAENDRLPNSQGVLQNHGVEVDRLCGELARTHEAAVAVQELITAMRIV